MSLELKGRKALDADRGGRGEASDATPGKRTLTSGLAPAAAPAPAAAAPATAPAKPSPRAGHAAAARATGRGDAQLDDLERSSGPFDVGRIHAHTDPGLLAAIAGPGAATTTTAAEPAAAASTGAPVVQRQPSGKQPAPAACNIPFPRVQYDTPNGPICRRFDGVMTYSTVSKARLTAAGYKFWITDAGFDKWVKIDRSSELWIQLSKINAATSEKAIAQLHAIVAQRRAQLDQMEVVAKLMNDANADVAAEARKDWDELTAEFPGFDDDYAQIPALRDQVDAEHRKAFEDSVDEIMVQRDRWDPQSTRP
jgi:hypothetical protein